MPLPTHYLVQPEGAGLMAGSGAASLRPGQARAFSIALTLHVLLAVAVIYLVVPPRPTPEQARPIEIVKLPNPPKAEPAKAVPQKPVVEPPPPKAVTPPPRPLPPPPRPTLPEPVPAPPIAAAPMPVAPVQESPPPLAELPPFDAVPAAPPSPPPAPPKVVEEYIPPSSDAAYLHNPKPVYPLIAQRRGWQGVTLLEVRVSAQGKPLSVSIKKSSGHTVLDDTARDMVLNSYRFEPARRNGEEVEATVELPMRFTLN